jgi:hypothetical protein
MLGNYRVSKQLGISRIVLSFMELVSQSVFAMFHDYYKNLEVEWHMYGKIYDP